MTYSDLNPSKKAFIFELDNVLYPAKDYNLQVYYLFANLLEYHEAFPPADDLLQFMKKVYEKYGSDRIFDKAKEVFGFEEKYREGFERLLLEAKLPLKLLLFQNMLTLLQDMVVDRKQIFILTSGHPQQQLNKIRQTEWHGLEKFLKVYFADELREQAPELSPLGFVMKENKLQAVDVLMIGELQNGESFASEESIDYLAVTNFI